ncbi:site-2 protease family protein [Clostridium aestuarii]|uniref:Site-2 protease family protein n=1 Tax=Clostridium aestuarii TaxID=338193 RepID=A0ABT4CZP4_9CLOT|nr:site-2 protease family protein [Clostridium aestuarii]MCY6484457.1 site-2 protease family protein [Clostridium aestuarii]
MFRNFDILQTIFVIPGILMGFTFHEYAHAWVADRLGDKTPKFQGRLTLNPITHIDPIGFLMILFVGFGWAKPVQTNPSAFKNYYKDDLKVSIVGVVGNLFVALVFSIIFAIIIKYPIVNGSLSYILKQICLQAIYINCLLVVFNLIPLPGLDGFHVLRDLFPKFFYNIAGTIYRYQMLILLIFIMSPVAKWVIYPPTNLLFEFFYKIIALIV